MNATQSNGTESASSSITLAKHSQERHVARDPVQPEGNQETKPPKNPNDPPNGGLQAWLQVLASFFLFMNSWGLINTFGVFQTYYASTLLASQSESNISWIGSIVAFILLGSPILYGPIFDKGHPRLIVACGTLLVAFGLMMTSLCHTLWQLVLAQGICVGLGSGAFFLTGVAIVPTYFSTRKSLAMGIAASGSSIGGVLYPIIFSKLQPRLGFPWAVRILSFVVLATCAVPITFIRMRVKPGGQRKFFTTSVFRELKFNAWCLAWFFGNMGLYIPFFFIQQYATSVSGLPYSLAFYTLTVVNAASIFGRILPGLIADRAKDPLLVIGVFTACSTVLAYSWIAINSTAGLFAFCILYGFCSGAFVSLSTPATVALAQSLDGIGTRLGIFNFMGSLGLLVGNPAAGAIINFSWKGAQAFCGTATFLAFGLIAGLWLFWRREKRVRRDLDEEVARKITILYPPKINYIDG